MSENEGGASNFAFFIAGIGFGAVLALLFAPKSGEETRDMLSAKANQSRDYLTTRSKEVRQQAEQYVEKAKDMVAQQKEQLSAALEAGKQAYQEEKTKSH
ncbi:MAG TPA: YtxH domain-containing protein [Terriglobia bacterium]|nr:YtxH domain-containing protein [Terriglobia bacterium]